MTRTLPVDPSPGRGCLEVREALDRGEPLSAAAEAHAAGCPVCALRSAELGPALPSPEDDAEALFSAVETNVAAERGFVAWLRSLPTRARTVTAALWVSALVALVAVTMPRTRFAPLPADRVVLVVTVLAALLAVALRLGLRPLQVAPPGTALSVVGFVAGLVAPFLFALGPSPSPFGDIPGVTFVQATVGCFVLGALVGGFVVVGLRLLDRGGHRSREAALFAATAGGLAANAALELHCPATAPAHLLLGHASVALVLVLVYGGMRRARS